MSPHQAACDTAEVGLTRLIRTLAVITPSLALIQALANAGDYRQPAAPVMIWLAVIGAGAWLVPRLRTGGLSARETAAAVAVAVGAVAAIGAVHRAPSDPGSVNLAILGTSWLLVLVVVSHPARVWMPAALLVFAVQGMLLINEQGLNLLSLSQLAAGGYIISAVMIAFAALRTTLEMHASMAARQSSLASRSAAERAAAAAVKQERHGRLTVLEQGALPLLRRIAAGTLDPGDDGVRAQCARQAAVLRHALTDSATGSGLAAMLRQALRAPPASGLTVAVQLIGDPGTPPLPIARAVLAVIDAVLGELPPHQVTLTVLAADDEVELYLAFSEQLRSMPDLTPFGRDMPAAARWHASVNTTETDGGYLEVSWRRDGAV